MTEQPEGGTRTLSTTSKPVLAHSFPEILDLMESLGEKPFRAKQLARWLWQRGAASYDEMTDLGAALRAKLALQAPLERCSVDERVVSKDGTAKFLVRLPDGVLVESVGLPSRDGRLTACISSQAGCAMSCTFCATGSLGLTRSLNCGEIADQVRIVADGFGRRVTNVVVMGQGEPFVNYDAVLGALRILNSPDGFKIGSRHITISTAGVIEGIRRFAAEPEQFTLAVSLHSALQPTRDALMPGLAGQELGSLLDAIVLYGEMSGRRPSLEYALVAGSSDTAEELSALVAFAKRARAHVNLIPINVFPGSPARPTSPKRSAEVRDYLEQRGVAASVRTERGSDIDAACGQLALKRKGMFGR